MSAILGNEFWLRDATMHDIDDICQLGLMLNTINLPSNKEELESVIALSELSFSLKEEDPSKRTFLFVLVNYEDRVIGTSQIFAKHGTLHFPHMYFQVGTDERYSETLKKYFCHQTLRLMQNFDGPTEIGSLILAKHFRQHPAKLGKPLSFVRFLFMAMNKDFFSSTIIAELLPPLGPAFESALWDAVGRKFTGLDYNEADMMSRKNKEFIKSLFPTTDIHVSLLPLAAQDVIGQVGENSRGAAHLLGSIGFRYSHRVDPFDGGPHFEAQQKDIYLIEEAHHGFAAPKQGSEEKIGLIGHYEPREKSGKRFKAILAPFAFDAKTQSLELADLYLKALRQDPGRALSAISYR